MSETEVSPEVNSTDQICQEFRQLVEASVGSETAVQTENNLLKVSVITAEYENPTPEALFAANKVIFRKIVQKPLTDDPSAWTERLGFAVELHNDDTQGVAAALPIMEIDLINDTQTNGEEKQYMSRRESAGYMRIKNLSEVKELSTALNELHQAGGLTPVDLAK